jgi:hypothetical protein
MPAVTGYTAKFDYTGSGWTCTLSRNSTTQPVDPTAGAPSRVTFSDPLDPGANGPLAQATITAATNATPIVLTNTLDNGTFANGDWVKITGVLGNLNANGAFRISSVSGSGTAMTLDGSAGSGAWTSGGKVQKMNIAPTFKVILDKMEAAAVSDLAINGY